MIASRVAPSRSPAWALLPLLALALAGCSTAGRVGSASWPSTSAGTDRVYVAYGPAVYAVDLEGKEVWRYPAQAVRDLTFYAAPAVSEDGMVYAGGYDGHVFALEAETGKVQWEFPSADGTQATEDGRVVGSPTIAGDLLLVPTDGGTLFFLDRQTGLTLRTFDAVGQLWSAPRVEGDTIYLASLAHAVYAIDLATAKQRWSTNLGFAVADSPTLENGAVLTAILGDALVALRAQDGKEMWRAPSQGWLWGSPAVVEGQAVFGDVSGNVYALNLADGKLLWQQTPGEAVTSSPVIVDGRVVVGFQSGKLIAYNLETHSVDWDKAAAGPILSDPVVAGGQVIVAVTSKDALLQAFDAATGDPIWSYLPASGG
jgi:outer membrane protein assembly factor BamB